VALELVDRPLEGALLAALASVASALRAPAIRPAVRGPGKWLALRPDEAFAAPGAPQHWMDAGGARGRVALATLAALTCGVALVSRRFSPEGPWLVALDAMALLPLFVTGRAVQLPPAGDRSAAPWLKRTFDRLRDVALLRAVPWARVTLDGTTIDELRLLVLPRAPMPGVAGIEVGLGWISTPVGWIGSPEVLVRVLDGTPAAERLAQVGPVGRTMPGRRPDERVLRATPRTRTPQGTASLVSSFADTMTDRRVKPQPGPWNAPDRRIFVASKASPASRPRAAA